MPARFRTAEISPRHSTALLQTLPTALAAGVCRQQQGSAGSSRAGWCAAAGGRLSHPHSLLLSASAFQRLSLAYLLHLSS